MARHSDNHVSQTLWGQHEVKENSIQTWRLGILQLWCRKCEKEIQLACFHHADEQTPSLPAVPDTVRWTRWAVDARLRKIELTPMLPDRSVVLKFNSRFWLTRHIKATIYVRIPVWLQVNLSERKKTKPLAEIPSVSLATTWFGDFYEGEVSYWIATNAARKGEPDPTRPYLAVCPLELINNSEEDLLVEKICFRVSNLSLFIHEGQLWSDLNRIYYTGEQEVSQVEASGSPPDDAKSAALIALPRMPQRKNLFAKTFSSIKDLPGLGIPTI
ncbi:MAG: DUF432 domain-containing protein [Candidatus Zhuqueibacterota bacterium]